LESRIIIYQKLEAFTRKFYTNELVRGSLLFIGFGLLYFLFTLFIEYFLWLQPAARTFLFWTFIFVELFLLVRFIAFPIFKIVKLKKGISYEHAAQIIGNHFPEVGDKLLNFLQLAQPSTISSELLVASIEQKSQSFVMIPFSNAINFKKNKRFLPIALIPLFFILLFYVSGNTAIISQSFNRVIHYNATFVKPAPFELVIQNSSLSVQENKKFVLQVKAVGNVVPENVLIYIGNESYFMEAISPGVFQFNFTNTSENLIFHLESNAVITKDYELNVIAVPSIASFEMVMDFPNYLNRKREVVKGTGNAIIPEGTKISWKIVGNATDFISFMIGKESYPLVATVQSFNFSKIFNQNTDYQVITSNSIIKNFEKLSYQLVVVKDQYPSIEMIDIPAEVKQQSNHLVGKINDDYGISKLQIVYYEKGKPQFAKRGTLNCNHGVFDQFVFSFPSNLPVEEGVDYDFYFEVFDNDALHNFKSTRSIVFSNHIDSKTEQQDAIFEQQNSNLNSLDKTLEQQSKQFSDLEKLKKLGKEKKDFEFKEQKLAQDFIQRQKQQDDLMKSFAEKIKDNLQKESIETKDETKAILEKRLEKATESIDKNKKLLDELNQLNDKLNNEEFQEKLQQFKQSNSNQVKTLEQLVELTKRYYVDKKTNQIADKLEKLSQEQQKLSDTPSPNAVEQQDKLSDEFKNIQEQLEDVKKENKSLKNPLELPNTQPLENSISNDMKSAKEQLNKKQMQSAKSNQKKAANELKSLSSQLKESMAENEQEQLEEDVKMLRQVLDNLLSFSFSQEEVMKQFKISKVGSFGYNVNLKKQQNLKTQFKHVDDSLFTLSLRNAKIQEEITKEVGNVQYNLDSAIDKLGNGVISKGVSHQQFSIASSNKLADFLSELLSNMQMNLSGMKSGNPKPGQGKGMQLPDIISKQKGLGDKMKKQMNRENKPGEGDPKSGSKGQKDANGNEGQDGEGDAKAIMQIYKEQKELRDALQNELSKQGLTGNGQKILEQMKQLEKQLLNKGFKNDVLQRLLSINQELLKLETALQQQGEDTKRKAESNSKAFNNTSKPLPASLLQYLNSVEILNRQSLPLQPNFNQKVQKYFNKND